ncbi:MAG: hypothetical protein JNL67_19055 [Planctomycetaceae bacterium]|nr:hypothetical protein [Planctomycetaceae bacterium]
MPAMPSHYQSAIEHRHVSRVVGAAFRHRGAMVWLLILVHVLSWFGLAVWNFFDPRLERIASDNLWSIAWPSPEATSSQLIVSGVQGILLLATLSGLSLVTSLLWAPVGFRSVRFIGLLVVFVSGWMALASQWQQIAWLGHRQRAMSSLEFLDRVAAELSRQWPRHDGENEFIGPFMAYPNWAPETLILLRPTRLGDQRRYLATVDRDRERGVLRFEVSDGYQTFWLEHQPPGTDRPGSFVNGIGAQYEIESWIGLNSQWRLSRYR